MSSSISCYLIVYNLVTWPKAMASQCAGLGMTPVLINMNSTFPATVEWLRACPYEVIHMKHNSGAHWVLSPNGPIRKREDGYFIASDPDLDLSGVPSDVVEKMVAAYERHTHVNKVGLSLEVEDIPEDAPLLPTVERWEKRHWSRQLEDGCYKANVDTTFALYHIERTGRNFYSAVRMPRPYTARHLPWYLTLEETQDNEELQQYYASLQNRTIVYSHRMRVLSRTNEPHQ